VDTLLLARGRQKGNSSTIYNDTSNEIEARRLMRYMLVPAVPRIANKHRPFAEVFEDLGRSQLDGNELNAALKAFIVSSRPSSRPGSSTDNARQTPHRNSSIDGQLAALSDLSAVRLFVDQAVKVVNICSNT
jgi:hypothetical protein